MSVIVPTTIRSGKIEAVVVVVVDVVTPVLLVVELEATSHPVSDNMVAINSKVIFNFIIYQPFCTISVLELN